MNIKKLSTGVMLIAMAMTVHTLSAQEKKKEAPEFPRLTVEQLQAAIKEGKVTIIDANGAESFNAAHVPGALHFEALKKEDALKKALPEDKATLIVAYCGGPQ